MRFDMHCHTNEGSPDGRIRLSEYISILKEKKYQGMLITDHNSYKAYRYYLKYKDDPIYENFTVLKGIEYDTIDAGHFLVIVPENAKIPILELRGLSVKALIEIVHSFGGILGPAHPCGEKYLSLCNTKRYRKDPDIMKQFDFVETFNSCESMASNCAAHDLAKKYSLPGFGGSDAHKSDCAGMAYTDFNASIFNESELIQYIREKKPVRCWGTYYHKTTKQRIGSLNHVLVYSFWVYNKSAALLRSIHRQTEIKSYLKNSIWNKHKNMLK